MVVCTVVTAIKTMKNVLVLVPKQFSANKSGFIEGVQKEYFNVEAYYITNPNVLTTCKNHIGYTGKFLTREHLSRKTIFIERGTDHIQINDEKGEELHVIAVFYDFDAFQSSNVVCGNDEKYGVHINELTQRLARNKNKVVHTNGNKPGLLYWLILLVSLVVKIFSKYKLKNCAIITYLESSARKLKWFLEVLEQERNLSPRIGNLLLAKLVDFTLGIGFIYLCLKYQCIIVLQLEYLSQDFVTHLRELLIYLMGSPIGLKLNYAFNHSLGRFFFYHINLWRVFLQAMQPLLETNFKLLLVPALFGLSCQIAMFCDIISLVTFHVYCIYVYAARLFSLQIKGLTSLWRLFIGRKSNPLRSRVDSCEYSSNQLFIGTLGFTILLFLLPTTTMYYTVFAAFRLATLLTYRLFTKIKDLIGSIPLYIVILWIFRSPSIAGALHIDWIKSTQENTRVEAKLAPLSLKESIEKFSSFPEEIPEAKQSFGTVLSNLFTGQLV